MFLFGASQFSVGYSWGMNAVQWYGLFQMLPSPPASGLHTCACVHTHTHTHAQLLQSCPTLCKSMDYSLPGSSVHGDSPDKNTGVGYHFLLQGDLPNPGIELAFPALQAESLPLNHQGRYTHTHTHVHSYWIYLFSNHCSWTTAVSEAAWNSSKNVRLRIKRPECEFQLHLPAGWLIATHSKALCLLTLLVSYCCTLPQTW